MSQTKLRTDVFVLESPVLTNGMFARLQRYLDQRIEEIDCTYDHKTIKNNGEALRDALNRIRADALKAIEKGAGQIILTDERQGPGRIAVPMILAVGGVHAHLIAAGKRSYCSIIVRSAECVDAHYMAVLVGVGATAVNPYLAFDSLAAAHERGDYGARALGRCVYNYKCALEAGLFKIMSKMGISVISSYRGGCNFEALGLSPNASGRVLSRHDKPYLRYRFSRPRTKNSGTPCCRLGKRRAAIIRWRILP